MALFDPIRMGASGVSGGYEIQKSIMMDGRDDQTNFRFTPSSQGDRRKFTISWWMKACHLVSGDQNNNYLFSARRGSNNPQFDISFNHERILCAGVTGGTQEYLVITKNLFRDPTAWMHCVVIHDTSNSTSSDRIRIFVNGVRVTEFDNTSYPSSGFQTSWNTNEAEMNIGRTFYGAGNHNFDGYLAEIHNISGHALDPDNFAEADSDTGQWIPKKYTGTDGDTSCRWYLKFTDNSNNTAATIGKDYSGQGNNWTPYNIDTHNSVPDSPTNNFCNMNFIGVPASNHPTMRRGGLSVQGPGSGIGKTGATFGLSSGKWYVEVKITHSGSNLQVGIININTNYNNNEYLGSGSDFAIAADCLYARIRKEGSNNQTSLGGMQNGDILGFAIDMDNGTFQLYNNGSTKGSAVSFTVADYAPVTFAQTTGASSSKCEWNFGQDSSFGGAETAQGNTDGNGFGDFYYSPPSGYLAVCSENLPDPTITTPSDYFDIVLYTGNGGNQTINQLSFQPDWVWIKRRQSENHFVTDSVRGAGKHLRTDSPSAESNDSATFTAFTSNGFSLTGSGAALPQVNTNGGTYVAWNWLAGTSFSNSAGSNSATIASSGSKNTTAGFSIVSYTGNATRDQKVYHGLNAVPKFILVKRRDGDNWIAYHAESVDSNPQQYYYEFQNQDAIKGANTAFMWDDISPDSNIFGIYSDGAVNNNGTNIIAYVFAEVAGFSRFGHYIGNGNFHGQYIYLGFRPALVIVKSNANGEPWVMYDSKRNPNNAVTKRLRVNESSAEDDASGRYKDFLANGFKARGTSGEQNSNGQRYIYMAWAESPFKYARAR